MGFCASISSVAGCCCAGPVAAVGSSAQSSAPSCMVFIAKNLPPLISNLAAENVSRMRHYNRSTSESARAVWTTSDRNAISAGDITELQMAQDMQNVNAPTNRIDAHHHLWRYQPHEFGWINQQMSILRRDFLPHDLRPLL